VLLFFWFNLVVLFCFDWGWCLMSYWSFLSFLNWFIVVIINFLNVVSLMIIFFLREFILVFFSLFNGF